MSDSYKRLLEGNQKFITSKLATEPDFFERLSQGQRPEFLWVGCSDSRVPADQITQTNPGEIFVTRNIANLVVHSDISLLSVLDFAVNYLKVRHIIVCGHYGCGGIKAALSKKQYGIIDNWLRNIKDVIRLHHEELDAIEDPVARERRLTEINVVEQAHNLCKTSIVQNSWRKSEFPHVHGWVYDVADGQIRNLGMDFKAIENNNPVSIYRLHEEGHH